MTTDSICVEVCNFHDNRRHKSWQSSVEFKVLYLWVAGEVADDVIACIIFEGYVKFAEQIWASDNEPYIHVVRVR